MSNPAAAPTLPDGTPAAGHSGRPDESDAAVEFLSALVPADPAVRRRAFAALLRAVTREVQSR